MDQYRVAELRKFCRWARSHWEMWSHIQVAGVAVQADQDQWLVLWLTLRLAECPVTPGVLDRPVVQAYDFIAFRVDTSLGRLWNLLGSVLRGRIPLGLLPGVPVPLLMTSPPGRPQFDVSFRDCLPEPSYMASEANGWPYARLEIQGGTLNDWKDGHVGRYERLNKAERLFRINYPRNIGELAAHLGATANENQSLWSARTGARIVAPLLARIQGVTYDRDADLLRVQVMVGRLVARQKLKLVVAYAGAMRPPERADLSGGTGAVEEVVFPKPIPGQATVSLCLEGEGEISSEKHDVRGPHRAWPRSVVSRLLDPAHERLRADLQSTKPDEHERGITMLLNLVGYSASWWTRSLRQPTGVSRGMAPDVVAFREDDGEVLVVECTTEQCGDSKVNKLRGRMEDVRAELEKSFGQSGPRARSLLAIGCPKHQIAAAIRAAAKANQTGLMSQTDSMELLDMIARGQSRREVRERFESLFGENPSYARALDW